MSLCPQLYQLRINPGVSLPNHDALSESWEYAVEEQASYENFSQLEDLTDC